MKLFRTLALVGAGLLVRKWAAKRAAGSRASSAKSDGFNVDTRPMSYPLEKDAAPDTAASSPPLTGRPVHP
jgi:hypothetical protein